MASSIFVGILTILIVFADSPKELVSGRSLFFFSIPIVFASVLLRPWMSIGIALVCTIAQLLLSYLNFIPVNTLAIGGFLVLALFSWLSANGIESALTELRTINQDLDARVARRTEELAITNERLKELDLIRAKFVADVSHELRTPVGNLVAYLEMLHEKMEDPVRTKRYLTVLQDETQRLHSLVNSVLNLSRLEIGTSKLEFTSVNISDIAEQVVLAHDLRAKAHGLKIIFQPGKDIPAIWADSDQIKQVFNNILGNAVNYTMQNGKITVKTYAEQD
ncbi:MAG: hypothetical protein HUU38_28775, partial [Anaerolineales bacterium]|nr:hypothetical protein [Anaerolineales bacterium]